MSQLINPSGKGKAKVYVVSYYSSDPSHYHDQLTGYKYYESESSHILRMGVFFIYADALDAL
jgi:hypothetical protein